MLGDLFTGWHLIIVLGIVVLLFGATKLPALSKGVGQSIRIFRSEMKTDEPKAEASVPAAAPEVAAREAVAPDASTPAAGAVSHLTSPDSQPKP